VDSASKKPIGIVTETDMLRLLARMLKGQANPLVAETASGK
jgi:hypothetical protein